jgi:hypothetical protein
MRGGGVAAVDVGTVIGAIVDVALGLGHSLLGWA